MRPGFIALGWTRPIGALAVPPLSLPKNPSPIHPAASIRPVICLAAASVDRDHPAAQGFGSFDPHRPSAAMARLALALACLLAACSAAQAGFTVKDVLVSLQEASGSSPKALDASFPAKLPEELVLDHTLKLKVRGDPGTLRVQTPMHAVAAELQARCRTHHPPLPTCAAAFHLTLVPHHNNTPKQVSFSVEADGAAARPQQAFLRLTSEETGAAAYFAATKSGAGGLVAVATSAGVAKQLGTPQGGRFAASLLLGNAGVSPPLDWQLADVAVRHTPLDDGSQPAPGPVRAVDALFAPSPEIFHIHRKPEKRAPAAVSLLFTGATLAPLAALLAGLALAGANLKVGAGVGGWRECVGQRRRRRRLGSRCCLGSAASLQNGRPPVRSCCLTLPDPASPGPLPPAGLPHRRRLHPRRRLPRRPAGGAGPLRRLLGEAQPRAGGAAGPRPRRPHRRLLAPRAAGGRAAGQAGMRGAGGGGGGASWAP